MQFRPFMFKSKKSLTGLACQSEPKTAIFSGVPAGLTAGIALIVIAGFLVYLPCLNGPFAMDDDLLVSDNSLVQSQDGLHRFWCTTESLEYYPLTYSIFWMEWRLWGTSPGGYHVTSLILQILESLLIWIILRKLSIPGAFLAALIFAVHPVNVESVAWIAQLRNMLALLFFLLSTLWYLKGLQRTAYSGQRAVDGGQWYWLSLAAFVLAMLGKGSAAVLPVLLLVIVWWLAAWQDVISCERPRFS